MEILRKWRIDDLPKAAIYKKWGGATKERSEEEVGSAV
jgi:hypothetical protein